MIRVQQFTEFTQIANELLALYREGCELKQTYPLLRQWQEILKAMPLEARKLQPWIVCDMPPGCSQSYVVQTTHPTKADDSWRMEWMPFDISPSDEQEIRDHLSKMLEAWLRVVAPSADQYSRIMAKADVAKLLGISDRTLTRRIAEGKLRYLDNEKRTIRIHLDHLPK